MIKDNKDYDEFGREEEVRTTSTSLELITISLQIKGHIQARDYYEARNHERKVLDLELLITLQDLVKKSNIIGQSSNQNIIVSSYQEVIPSPKHLF